MMASTSMTILNFQPATLVQLQVTNSIRPDLQTIPANTFTLITYRESGTHYQLLTSMNIQQESKVNYQNTYGTIF